MKVRCGAVEPDGRPAHRRRAGLAREDWLQQERPLDPGVPKRGRRRFSPRNVEARDWLLEKLTCCHQSCLDHINGTTRLVQNTRRLAGSGATTATSGRGRPYACSPPCATLPWLLSRLLRRGKARPRPEAVYRRCGWTIAPLRPAHVRHNLQGLTTSAAAYLLSYLCPTPTSDARCSRPRAYARSACPALRPSFRRRASTDRSGRCAPRRALEILHSPINRQRCCFAQVLGRSPAMGRHPAISPASKSGGALTLPERSRSPACNSTCAGSTDLRVRVRSDREGDLGG